MDTHTIYQLFSASYHSDRNIRKQAELQIKQVETTPEFFSIILQLMGSEELELGARQAAAIYLKNRIRKSWNVDGETQSGGAIPISTNDREMFKRMILQILVNAQNVVRLQLLECLNKALTYDFPDNWPDYMNQVHSLVASNDPRVVYIGLLSLLQVVKVFQWKTNELRGPLIGIIQTTFPAILQIAQNLVNEDSVDAAEMLRVVFKTYNSVIQYELIATLQENSSLIPWCTILLQIIAKPLPETSLPEDLEDRESYPWWKVKKWAYRILNRLFSRYGNPAQLPKTSKEYKGFAENFVHNFAPQILHEYLRQTDVWIQKKQWLSNKALFCLSDFYKDAITHKTTWQIFKAHSGKIVSEFIFPQLCFSEPDQELWDEDPVEYVHKKIDPLEDLTSPSMVAINLLMDLAKYRKKYTFTGILSFVNSILNTYLESSPEARDPRAKDGALRMVGCLADMVLSKKSNMAHLMEGFFTTHVFPEFRSQYHFLRARACDTLIRFSNIEFQNQSNLAAAFQGITECMQDPELPVKVQAALGLQSLIHHDFVKDALIPNLQMVMQELLNLTNQIDVDTLTTVTEEFVEVFSAELAPFAVQLCVQMRDTFLRLLKDLEETQYNIVDEDFNNAIDLDGTSDKTMAATGLLKTISTLILSLDTTPEIFSELQNTLLPVITYTLQKGIVDLYDEVFDVIDSCTFSTKQISPTMWNVFELIYQTFKTSGIDYLEEMLPALDNYISYGAEVFVKTPDLQGMIYDIVETVMKSDRLGDVDRVCACKLIESVLLNCRGHVDHYVEPFLILAFEPLGRIEEISNVALKVYCIEVVVNALFYNPLITLRILEERGLTQGFFTIWFNNLDKFTRVHDKKLVIVTLCTLIAIPVEQLPSTLLAGWPQVLEGILSTFKSLPKAEADDEDVKDEDTKYLEFITEEAANHVNEEDDEIDQDMEEEALFESPLDDINVYIRFQEIFIGLQQHNHTSYNLLTKNLNEQQSSFITSIFSKADEQRKEHQKIANGKE
ncbi:11131_t:CDS:10 [Ambispora gerdemannii]|uniref:11131_t:CDS:1 n=1 Tax=Ambispora gerdemannii TaxID=144530 RepID=A0A9N9AEB8_9GLOM|nr:11131_t:CDS:10 [Ambispora gerdemannii]